MKLSVIIVSYNGKKYLSQAIESCLSQTYNEFEIIIGDDGSDDGSIELIKIFHEKYPNIIRYFVMDRNIPPGGIIPSFRVSNVIKRGLSMAQGKYVICLSGDDYFTDQSSFEKQINFLEKDTKKKFSACITNFKKVWDDGKELSFPLKHLSPALYWSGNYLHLSCFMFRKEMYEQGMLLERFCDDTGLEFSLACMGKWKYVDIIAFAYRQREKSIMHDADIMELNILELLLLQDVLKKQKLRLSTLSRFAHPLKYVYDHNDKLKEDKYNKYLKDAEKYEYNILGCFLKFDEKLKKQKKKIHKNILFALILSKAFNVLRKLYR